MVENSHNIVKLFSKMNTFGKRLNPSFNRFSSVRDITFGRASKICVLPPGKILWGLFCVRGAVLVWLGLTWRVKIAYARFTSE